jgi:hypothetical protein
MTQSLTNHLVLSPPGHSTKAHTLRHSRNPPGYASRGCESASAGGQGRGRAAAGRLGVAPDRCGSGWGCLLWAGGSWGRGGDAQAACTAHSTQHMYSNLC